jgi:hypothetical protein
MFNIGRTAGAGYGDPAHPANTGLPAFAKDRIEQC